MTRWPWPPPSANRAALCVDGSFCAQDGSAAAGMVLRKEDGSIIFAAYWVPFHCSDALEAEVHAIRHTNRPVVV